MTTRINETWGGRYEVAQYDRKGRFVKALTYYETREEALGFVRGLRAKAGTK